MKIYTDTTLPLAQAIGGVALAFTELEAGLKECCIALAAIRGVEPTLAQILIDHRDLESLGLVLADMVNHHFQKDEEIVVVEEILTSLRQVVRRRRRYETKGPGHISIASYNELVAETRNLLGSVLALTECLHGGEPVAGTLTTEPDTSNVVYLRPRLRIVT
jgi:hypothetical protein